MKNIITLLIICILVSFYSCSYQNKTKGTNDSKASSYDLTGPENAASKAFADLGKLITDENSQNFGFTSPEELKQAQLGKPMQIHYVKFDMLVNFKSSNPFPSMFEKTKGYMFPILIEGKSKAVIIVTGEGDEWHISSIEKDNYDHEMLKSKKLMDFIPNASKVKMGPQTVDSSAVDTLKEMKPKGKFSLVIVPGLGYELAAYNEDEKWNLMPLENYPEGGILKGEVKSARQTMPRISAYAKSVKTNYDDELEMRKLLR